MVGRKSVVAKYNLEEKVSKLRKEGLTMTEIADSIKKDNGVVISTASVSRYLTGRNKQIGNEPTELMNEYKSMKKDILFKIDMLNVPFEVRRAIRVYINSTLSDFEKILRKSALGDVRGKDITSEVWYKGILQLSRSLSPSARREIADKMNELDLGRIT